MHAWPVETSTTRAWAVLQTALCAVPLPGLQDTKCGGMQLSQPNWLQHAEKCCASVLGLRHAGVGKALQARELVQFLHHSLRECHQQVWLQLYRPACTCGSVGCASASSAAAVAPRMTCRTSAASLAFSSTACLQSGLHVMFCRRSVALQHSC